MAAPTVTKFSALDVAAMDLSMGAPAAAGPGGARMAYLNTQPLVQLSKDMVAPFGLDDGTGRYASNKHSVKLSVADPELRAFLEAVDERLVAAAVADPVKFFTKFQIMDEADDDLSPPDEPLPSPQDDPFHRQPRHDAEEAAAEEALDAALLSAPELLDADGKPAYGGTEAQAVALNAAREKATAICLVKGVVFDDN